MFVQYFGHKISSEERLSAKCGVTIQIQERNCETLLVERSISVSAELPLVCMEFPVHNQQLLAFVFSGMPHLSLIYSLCFT
jgi:hypothetical protein